MRYFKRLYYMWSHKNVFNLPYPPRYSHAYLGQPSSWTQQALLLNITYGSVPSFSVALCKLVSYQCLTPSQPVRLSQGDSAMQHLLMSVCLSVSLSVSLCVCLCLPVSVVVSVFSLCAFVFLCVCLCLSLSVCLSVCLSVSFCLSVCLSLCLSVCLSL